MYVCTIFVPNDWTAASISTWEKFRWLNIDENVCQKTFSWNAAAWCSISQILFNWRLHQQGNACFFEMQNKKKIIRDNEHIDSHKPVLNLSLIPLTFNFIPVKIHSTPVWLHWPVKDWFSSLKTRKNGNFKWALGSSSRISITFFSYEIGSSLINSDGSTVAFVRS